MKVLCDEDVGTSVPRALSAVGFDVRALVSMGWGGYPDEFWLKKAGELELIVLSRNIGMLKVKAERNVITHWDVGIVFLTNAQRHPSELLLQLLKKWDDLELLWRNTPRPFARFLSANNRIMDSYRTYRF